MKWCCVVMGFGLLFSCSSGGSESEEKRVQVIPNETSSDSDIVSENKVKADSPDKKKTKANNSDDELVLPYIQKNVCPFEGCKYRKIWKTNSSADVYKSEDKTELLFALKKGESFKALKGNVHIIEPGKLVITESFLDFKKGEEIPVLAYKGEGVYDLWYKGKVFDEYLPELWSLVPPKGILKSKPQTEWWVYIVTERGKFGWIQADGKIDFD